MKQVIERWTNGAWRYVGELMTEFEAECAVKGLNAHGQWEYRFRKGGKR